MIVPVRKIMFAKHVQDWCKLPYGEHKLKSGEKRYTNPSGCRMYGTRKECPPKAEFFPDIASLDGYRQLDIPMLTDTFVYELVNEHEPTMFLVIEEFNLTSHMEKLRKIHEDWSDKQLACVYYYQPSLNKRLRESAEEFIRAEKPLDPVTLEKPEANGVNLFTTCAYHGVVLKRVYPLNVVKKMCMVVKSKFSVGMWFV
jgi:hypothetical protein